MSTASLPTADPIVLVQQLDADVIRERLEALDREREALLVLLRAALRMRRERAREPIRQEVASA
jgi:hypothetical protein